MVYTNGLIKSNHRNGLVNRMTSKRYWARRKAEPYYAKIIDICSNILINNENYSIIDFGCANTEVIFDLKCNKKFLSDKQDTYTKKQKLKIAEKNIKFLEQSIYDIKYENEFDVCVCLQTLEHLEDAKKAFELIRKASKKYTIISLPYCWGECEHHIHNYIDERVIKEWTGIDPDESFIVKSAENSLARIINIYIKK